MLNCLKFLHFVTFRFSQIPSLFSRFFSCCWISRNFNWKLKSEISESISYIHVTLIFYFYFYFLLNNEIKWISIEFFHSTQAVLFYLNSLRSTNSFGDILLCTIYTIFTISFWHIVINWFAYHLFTLDLDPLSIFEFEIYFQENKMLYSHAMDTNSHPQQLALCIIIYSPVCCDIQSSFSVQMTFPYWR